MGWDTLAAMAAVLAVAWSYGSAGEDRRLEFKTWLAGNIKRAKPTASILLFKSSFFVCMIGAGVIAWNSVWDIYEFKISLEPLTRDEIIHLLVVVFNAFFYSIASLVLAIVLFARDSNFSEVYWHRTGGELRLMFDKEQFPQESLGNLLSDGITLRVVNAKRGKVQLKIEEPKGVSIIGHDAAD
ncbi:hypothetical protein [uncultured Halopseudomonas sp.]|uniref:hypothetical protein n=1 Tax=uncultured Halopseudomonas sp. TaxID=2901193 RepID=UPI0030EEA124|tara:strand:- start:68741 stop:69292 length:552 start_codon:yes stop_codon:yes gene_type:complete